MNRKATIDLITEDSANHEFVLYVVEDGPWPEGVRERLERLQERLYDAIDIALDGHLVTKFPRSKGMNVRIQIDLHGQPPREVPDFVMRFREHVLNDAVFRGRMKQNRYVHHLRIVTGSEMGRKSSS